MNKNFIAIYLLLIAGFGFQAYNWNKKCDCSFKTAILPKTVPTTMPSLLPTAIPTVVSPTQSETNTERLLIEVNNISACSFTDRAEFTLDQKYFVTRFRTWYSWGQSETEIPYVLNKDGKEFAKGKLVRKDCDPYQSQWCIAADFDFNKELEPGNYEVKVASQKICQNSLSKNKGFIFVWVK